MALNGEQLWWHDAWSSDSDGYTASWTIDFAPKRVMAKVTPAFYMEYDDDRVSMFHTRITGIRRRLSSGGDETISLGNVPARFDNNMTSVTYGLYIYNCQVQVVLDLGYWA
jgi:hypothetical protein